MVKLARISVALVGVGNCASGLVQGLHYYRGCGEEGESVGLRRLLLGGYHPRDIHVAAAFDVDRRKVGRDLSEAVFAEPNNTVKLVDVPETGVKVRKGPVLDGVGEHASNVVQVSRLPEADVREVLEEAGVEIVVNMLPSGAAEASRWYAEEALKAGCAFVNATPVFIASDAGWAERFEEAGLPLVGDDLVDQVGATTVHKTLLKLLSEHGVRVTETYQLDVGGGTESLDTLERTRDVKRSVKTRSVEAALPYKADVVAGSTDYVDFLENRRDSYFWIKGLYFCRVPMQIDLRLSTVDAPNAGSALFDVIRAVKIALERRMKGVISAISSYAFKNPPSLMPVGLAEEEFAHFIKVNA